MYNHPFIRNVFTLLVILLITVLAGVLAGILMIYYQNLYWLNAFIPAILGAVIWLVAFYYSWYILEYVKVWQGRIVVGIGLQLIVLGLLYFFSVPTTLISEDDFICQLPFWGIFGCMMCVIVMQWYATIMSEDDEAVVPLSVSDVEESDSIPEKKTIDTLSVKSGSHIHIIPVEEIYFIQACGDYVNIFTRDGQFVKEQTMKSLEMILPFSFIRIHRSTIINSVQLLRIELFGKENYHVQLKNGSTLKASLTGYKLLRSRLNL